MNRQDGPTVMPIYPTSIYVICTPDDEYVSFRLMLYGGAFRMMHERVATRANAYTFDTALEASNVLDDLASSGYDTTGFKVVAL